MARPKGKKTDEGPSGPGDWIVTFSDCMTLLLCFFVMLLTFSSFDKADIQKLAGSFKYDSHSTIFPFRRDARSSYIPEMNPVVSRTDTGSEKPPPESPDQPAEFPRKRTIEADDDAYRDRKVIYIPSESMFLGRTDRLTAEGRGALAKIASFVQVIPCRVVIGENASPGAEATDDDARLARALRVMEFFTSDARLRADKFSITAGRTKAPARLSDRRVLTVSLLPEKVY
jgi:chemotaxis protein MotB